MALSNASKLAFGNSLCLSCFAELYAWYQDSPPCAAVHCATVSYTHLETDTHKKIQQRVEHDLYYIENWSVLFDLYILAKTPFALLKTESAY